MNLFLAAPETQLDEPQVECKMLCPFGFEKDAEGKSLCKCASKFSNLNVSVSLKFDKATCSAVYEYISNKQIVEWNYTK